MKSGGHLFEQTLNESVAVSKKIVPAYDLVFDTLSQDDRRAINEKLIRPMLENIARNKSGKNNWQTWHNAAFIWGGAILGEAEWIEAFRVPVLMDTTKARRKLRWRPKHDALETLRGMVDAARSERIIR